MTLESVDVYPADITNFEEFVGKRRVSHLQQRAETISKLLSGRAVINVNSTGKGGGVAEMLGSLLGYVRGVGIDATWQVIQGTPEFFRITKRIHNMLHGSPGDGRGLSNEDDERYREVMEQNAEDLRAIVSEGDVVILHDPQTAGLVAPMKSAGAMVVWRCHVGIDAQNEQSAAAWTFLRPYLDRADAFVFSREESVPDFIDKSKVVIIPPSIDPFSTKNRPMSAGAAQAILTHTGILRQEGEQLSPEYTKVDGSIARVNHMADIVHAGPAPVASDRMVLQVSRWDRLKDMVGAMEAFATQVDGAAKESRLVLAGPVVTGVADDPEGGRVLTECVERWRELPHFERSRIQLVCLPMIDVDENAAIVNALQTHATLVVQKSLQEGFGLTVTEPMWKGKPVVASAIGGIQDQVEHGKSGMLVQDPRDYKEFGDAVRALLNKPDLAARLGENARERVRKHFLGDRHLLQYADLLESLVG